MATYDLSSTTPQKIETGDILNCPYTGAFKSITLYPGTYKLQVWGARGATFSATPGYGGYSVGTLNLSNTTTLYLYAGGMGSSTTGGFNGGGNGVNSGGGGGGGSDIRIGQNSLYARVIVAGGGGGSGYSANAYGGGGGGTYGLSGYQAQNSITGTNRDGGGATQTQGGVSWNSISSTRGTFGQGGNAYNYTCGGGGGGWYGGGGAYDNDSDRDGRNGGGGSGYIYTSSTAANYPSGCLLNSSYYLSNANTYIANTTFTSPSGSNETGHNGSGYCRITVISCQPPAGIQSIWYKATPNQWNKIV